MEVNEQETVTGITVTHPGYYYVYSHVTYKPSTLSISHMIYKNYRYFACGRLNETDIETKRRKRKPYCL